MTRGEFLSCVMALYGLSGWTADTPAFTDVPESSPWYDAVMTARCAGIIQGSGNNRFSPDLYISAPSAQAILSATLRYVGLEDQHFAFTPGEQSYISPSYTRRADIAEALYTLRSAVPLAWELSFPLRIQGQSIDGQAQQVDGSIYLPLALLQQQEPSLTLTETTDETTAFVDGMPVPFAQTQRVALRKTTLQTGQSSAAVSTFTRSGTQYVSLYDAARLLGWSVSWNSADCAIEVTTAPAITADRHTQTAAALKAATAQISQAILDTAPHQ